MDSSLPCSFASFVVLKYLPFDEFKVSYVKDHMHILRLFRAQVSLLKLFGKISNVSLVVE